MRDKIRIICKKVRDNYASDSILLYLVAIFFKTPSGFDHQLRLPVYVDLLVDDHFIFEIGGKNKQTKQIKDLPNAYVVPDDIETGIFNQVPLWMFGFLY